LPCEILAMALQNGYKDDESLLELQFLLSRLYCGTSSTKEASCPQVFQN